MPGSSLGQATTAHGASRIGRCADVPGDLVLLPTSRMFTFACRVQLNPKLAVAGAFFVDAVPASTTVLVAGVRIQDHVERLFADYRHAIKMRSAIWANYVRNLVCQRQVIGPPRSVLE